MAPARPCARVGFKISLDIECEDVSLLVVFIGWWGRLAGLDNCREVTFAVPFEFTKMVKAFRAYFNM